VAQNYQAVFVFKKSKVVEIYVDIYKMYKFGPIIDELVIDKGYVPPMIDYFVDLGNISDDIVELLDLNHESEIVILRYDLSQDDLQFSNESIEAFRTLIEKNNYKWGNYYEQ